MEFGRPLKKLWYLEDGINFLNNGSFGATPIKVIDRSREIEIQMETEPVRFFMEEYPGLLENAINKVSEFCGADPKDLVLIENATSGINTILRSLIPEINKGDVILISDHVYPAIKITTDYICSVTGAEIRIVEIPFPIENIEAITNSFKNSTDSRVTIAIYDHVTSATGLILPVEELTAFFKENGIISIIDGAHAPGMLDLDISALQCDFYVANCHKWLFAPKGCALMYAAHEFQEKIHPLTISHNYKKGFGEEFAWVGTRNPSSWLALPEAIDFYNSLGGSELRKYNHDLIMEAGTFLNFHLGSEFNCPEEMAGSILTLAIDIDLSAKDSTAAYLRTTFLREYKTELMFIPFKGKIWYRIAAQVYNEIDDYVQLADSLGKFIKRL